MFSSKIQVGHEEGSSHDNGVLLVQLGTPSDLTKKAVRSYLAEFLSDPRVVSLPKWLWLPILYGIVLPFRPAKALLKYQEVWLPEGAPLFVHSKKQADLLQNTLDRSSEAGPKTHVKLAMRYGQPSMEKALLDFRAMGIKRILVIPLYPQYCGATTGSVIDELFRILSAWPDYPELHIVRDFFDNEQYLDVLARHISANGWTPPDRLIISFHGVPVDVIKKGDPYYESCRATAASLAARLGLGSCDGRLESNGPWVLTFQSRFGFAQWLGPDTEEVLSQSARLGRVEVVCPGFVSDCLETLEEICIRGKEVFEAAGGENFRYIPCLNGSTEFTEVLASLVQKNLF